MDALSRAKCARIYQEKASGAKTERPELMKLLDTARKGNVVIVWKLDRLARSLRQLIDTTVMLNERGVELHSLTENINTTSPSGKLTFHIFAALAEFEPDILRQRVANVRNLINFYIRNKAFFRGTCAMEQASPSQTERRESSAESEF